MIDAGACPSLPPASARLCTNQRKNAYFWHFYCFSRLFTLFSVHFSLISLPPLPSDSLLLQGISGEVFTKVHESLRFRGRGGQKQCRILNIADLGTRNGEESWRTPADDLRPGYPRRRRGSGLIVKEHCRFARALECGSKPAGALPDPIIFLLSPLPVKVTRRGEYQG